ncbi:hypothetical protein Tco_0419346 [Tanacetum coccineum]
MLLEDCPDTPDNYYGHAGNPLSYDWLRGPKWDDKPEKEGLMAYLPAYAGACRLALRAFQSLFKAKDKGHL